jgi:hypothetical protein
MFKYLSLFVLVFGLISCDESQEPSKENAPKSKSEVLPKSNGSHAEMLALVKDKTFYGPVGEAVVEVFARDQDGLPQPESLFKVVRVEPAAANRLLKRNKTVLIIELGDSSEVSVVKDVWARPQIVATITAPTVEELGQLVKEYGGELVKRFQEHDRMIMRGVIKRTSMRKLPEAIEQLGIKEMLISGGFKQTLDRENLKIFKNKALRTDQYLIFYTEPMREGVVSGEEIIASRDSIGKNFMEGERDSSYMTTEMLIPPVQQIVDVGDLFAVETRGLWKTVGDFMGGPFISYTIYDEVNAQILVVESMVYGPDSKKRNVLFELETMMRSIRMD